MNGGLAPNIAFLDEYSLRREISWQFSESQKVRVGSCHLPATSQLSLMHRRAGDSGDASSEVPDRILILVRHGQYDLSTGQLTQLGMRVTTTNKPLL